MASPASEGTTIYLNSTEKTLRTSSLSLLGYDRFGDLALPEGTTTHSLSGFAANKLSPKKYEVQELRTSMNSWCEANCNQEPVVRLQTTGKPAASIHLCTTTIQLATNNPVAL